MVYIRPYDSKRRIYEELLFAGLTVILIISCSIYTLEEASSTVRKNAMKMFIYTFISMMGLVVLLILFDLSVWIKSKLCPKSKDKQEINNESDKNQSFNPSEEV